jgi:hypothetical protein
MWGFWILDFGLPIADCVQSKIGNRKSKIANTRSWRYAGYCDFPGALLIT